MLATRPRIRYDGKVIPRVKGKQREVRRLLAQRCNELQARYRGGECIPEACPFLQALRHTHDVGE
jgi:hypothetical protein